MRIFKIGKSLSDQVLSSRGDTATYGIARIQAVMFGIRIGPVIPPIGAFIDNGNLSDRPF